MVHSLHLISVSAFHSSWLTGDVVARQLRDPPGSEIVPMRRRIAFAAILGSLILAACSDASRQGPSDGPAFDKGIPCPDTAFPLDQANALITQLYPAGTGGHGKNANDPRGDMLAKAKDISEKWSKCKVADPQGKVVTFVTTVLSDFNGGNLIGGTSSETAVLVGQLVNVMYAGVGFGTDFPAPPLPEVPTSGPDYGIGFFTPGQQLLVQTSVLDGAVLIPSNGFTEPTTITIYLRPDTPNPFDASGHTVYPPFYEITASNLGGTHYLANGQAVVGFCLDDAILNSVTDPAIAHLAVPEGSNAGGFEVLNDATDPQYASLGLDCARYAPPVIGSLFDHGLRGFASAAPRVAARYLRSAAKAIFLPAELNASAYFGKIGLGGLASSLSPFGVTDRNASPPTSNVLDILDDPSDAYYFPGGSLDTCHDGCPPDVLLLAADSTPIGEGTDVTVSLRQVAGTGGVLSGTTTQPTDANSTATFNDLSVSAPGQYQLIFTAPGAAPDTSGTFDVYQLEFQTQPTATAGETITPGDFLGESVGGFPENVVQVKVVDFNGITVTDAEQDIVVSLVGPTGATLNGDQSVSPSGGVASFTEITDISGPFALQDGLRVSTGGQLINGLQLGAQVYDEPPVLSATFNVDGQTF
jgi:hypothetical protein